MKKKLEEIIWKDKHWFKVGNEIVKPEPIGESFIVELTKKFGETQYQESIEKIIDKKLNEVFSDKKNKINAYSIGEVSEEDFVQYFNCPLTFYKI